MDRPKVVSRDEWLTARRELLAREKELTWALDGLNADRRRLPMVRVEKDYRFSGPDGEVGLLDLFDGRRQLVLQHFMFDPSWDRGCGSCSAMADDLSEGARAHLSARDTTFAAVSRAPYAKLAAEKQARGWTFPWYSSFGSDFNYDFHFSLNPAVRPNTYNFRGADELVAAGQAWLVDYVGEQPGISAFLRDGDEVFHTYATYGRGVEVMMHAYRLLDVTVLGRQEEWEEPKGRVSNLHSADPSFTD
ncbi:Predicted dithiol-disulfide oxidoreductase, DUF899 family [Amycolatopsis arida]|uniref:Predicted dithiol-disulfide oxidoreductase, DUF899 family n=1 Tax=Amycolatopsis arida TaxID=587909 RepID=A0A1I5Q5P3_9PSEU|nr:DUF899 domain-containing protein [Amycolatopsis arida]TDX98725.1 putative dithiol-disulfide oxidoreductase (DUF899 family) [Amycolatopsis arida]SFP41497.1 Predicted dithiol-disulfide oxidoreductase, DUF899 family [Amycolatopsis arida]